VKSGVSPDTFWSRVASGTKRSYNSAMASSTETAVKVRKQAEKTRPRVFVSVPDDRHLDNRRKRLKRSIIAAIMSHGIEVTGFEPEQFDDTIQANLEEWTAERAGELMKRCDGALVLALGRTRVHILGNANESTSQAIGGVSLLPTVYNHLEGALAFAARIPLFILIEQGMERTGIFASGTKPVFIPSNADEGWPGSQEFQRYLATWAVQLRLWRDVFLGYCGKASECATQLRDYLEAKGFSVVDWARDFKPAGATILEEIEKSSRRCRTAVFLFTKDDEVRRNATRKASFDAIPRDNVLLEAGY
jgi:hypothetical protein